MSSNQVTKRTYALFWTLLSQLLLLAAVLAITSTARGQGVSDALRYSARNPGNDPVNIAMGGASVANATGFGSFVENPATAALFNTSFVSFSLSSRRIEENGNYLGNSLRFDDNETNIGDMGFLYKVPTATGSMAFGLGYSQIADFNRAFSVSGNNQNNSITDFFAENPFYQDIAFGGQALDEDDDGFLQSRLRFGEFQGIDQFVEEVLTGQLGEFALFGATEFQQNLFIGASLSFPVGQYKYRRFFIEEDSQNLYQTFPDDISLIEARDDINADITGFYGRVGLIYKTPVPGFNIGLSYRTPTRLQIDETFASEVFTTFDDGAVPDADQIFRLEGEFDYKIINPGQITLGASIANVYGFTLNVSADYIDYTNMEFEMPDDKLLEIDLNQEINRNMRQVWNLRSGASLQINEHIQPRVGVAYYPAPDRRIDNDRMFLSGGLGIGLSDGFSVDIGVQYGVWDDQSNLYSVGVSDQNVAQSVNRFHTMVGFKWGF